MQSNDLYQDLSYKYDPVGNINTITDALSGPQTQSFTYDALDRLLSSEVTGGSNGLYSEAYSYDWTTGNLASKGGVNYTYNSGHAHGVSSLDNGNMYGYDSNGNMISRNVGGQPFTLNYDAENRLVSISGAATASFSYDADGKQIRATVNGMTTVYVGNHYEVKNNVATKYYFAGATRLAVRTNGTLSFLLGDHLGSSSVTTDANGAPTASALYKAFGETRYTFGSLNTDYHFTEQREEVSLGIYFFNARWYDGQLGRFLSPDSIVPTQTQGTQAWDRYAFVNNNPVRYNDPTGHMIDEGEGGGSDGCTDPKYCKNGNPKSNIEEDDTDQPITDFILALPGSADFYSDLSTGLDIFTWLIDAYAVGVVIYGGVAGAGLSSPLIAAGLPEVPVATGAAGAAIAELAVQPLLGAANGLATLSTAAIIISDTKASNTNIDQGIISTTVTNSFTLSMLGWANKEAFISLTFQTFAVTNDLGWSSIPFK